MKRNGKQSLAIQQKFEEAARRHRRNPDELVEEFMQNCLETWEDKQLDEKIGKQAPRSGLKENDAVKVVRDVRQASKRRGNS
jgi:hypothetical protein